MYRKVVLQQNLILIFGIYNKFSLNIFMGLCDPVLTFDNAIVALSGNA